MKKIEFKEIEPLLKLAFEEDIRTGDISSSPIFESEKRSKAYIIAKENGIFCGGFMASYVYSMLNNSVECSVKVDEGSTVLKGDIVIELEGPTLYLLTGERTLLNFLQRMCGIATKTSKVVGQVEGTGIKILDTRKTLPGFRLLDKYSVEAGGGTNHRMGLFDMVMIKDNHIKAAGSITKAVETIRSAWGSKYKVEVETTSLDEVSEACSVCADIIMLDNMNKSDMERALIIINKKAQVEISGNMDANKIDQIKDLAVDFISIGALTHSVNAFDLSMKFK